MEVFMKKIIALSILCTILATGCYYTSKSQNAIPFKKYKETIVHDDSGAVWFGLFKSPGLYYPTAIDEKCKGKGNFTETRGFTKGLLTMVTLGIYGPIHITITCYEDLPEGTTLNIELTPSQAMAVVAHPNFLKTVEKENPELLADATIAHEVAVKETTVCKAE